MAQIVRRGENRWQVLIFKGRNALGKRQFHIKTVRGTKKAALAYAREIETSITSGTFAEPTRQTVSEYLAAWLSGAAAQRLREPTLRSYSKVIDAYIIPRIGEQRMSRLRLPEIETVYAQLRASGLSARTVRYTHSILRTALNHAVRSRLILHNPTDHATLPRQERREMKCLSAAETVRFLGAAKDDRWFALFEILTMTGLRPSEALALKWTDISGNSVIVQRSLVKIGAEWTTSEPKTRKSRRTLPLPDSTIRALQAHRRVQAEDKLRAGGKYVDNNFIFATSDGTPLDIKNLTNRHFRKILKRADLPAIRLYDLRHTAATLMLSAGVNPKVASERLGHSTITLTMDTYSHVLPDMQQDAVDRVDRLLSAAAS